MSANPAKKGASAPAADAAKIAGRYPITLQWDDEDGIYIATIHGLSYGGTCHGTDAGKVFAEAREIAVDIVETSLRDGRELSPPPTDVFAVSGNQEMRTEADPDPKEIRKRLELTQGDFATLLGIDSRTYTKWEYGDRRATGAARTLLRVAESFPGVLQQLMADTASAIKDGTVQAAHDAAPGMKALAGSVLSAKSEVGGFYSQKNNAGQSLATKSSRTVRIVGGKAGTVLRAAKKAAKKAAK